MKNSKYIYDLYIHEVYGVFGVSFYYIDLLILCLLAFGFFFLERESDFDFNCSDFCLPCFCD